MHLLAGVCCILVSNSFNVFSVIAVRYSFNLIDQGLDYGNMLNQMPIFEDYTTSFKNVIILYIIVYFSVKLIGAFFLFLTRQTIIVMSRRIENDLKNEIYEHYQSLPLSFYRKNRTGDLMARISEDVSKVRMYLGPGIMYGINTVALFSITITCMFNVNAELAIYTLLPLPFLSVAIYFVSDKMNKHSTIIQNQLSTLSNFVQEAFSGIRVLKSFVREQDSYHKFIHESEDYKDKSLKLIRINSLFVPLIFLLIGLSTALTVYVGGQQVLDGNVTIGNIAEFVIYINMLTWPVASLGWITSIIQRAAASQTRINEFLNTKTDLTSDVNLTTDIKGDLVFENVNVVYENSQTKALQDLNLKIKAGENIGIIGSTGSGKSTLTSAIPRLFDPTEGRITLDGNDLKDYDINFLRDNIGFVPQDVFLFSDTIKENIAFGSPNVTQEEIEQAAKDADVYQNIMDFAEKFETEVGERGISLSGGQKQRISIARAIIKKPKILIFDDCLSAVDTKTEEEILSNLRRIMKGRTSIIVAHRISSVQWTDRIYVMDDGKIMEQGSHEELIAQKGSYAELYEKQLLAAEE